GEDGPRRPRLTAPRSATDSPRAAVQAEDEAGEAGDARGAAAAGRPAVAARRGIRGARQAPGRRSRGRGGGARQVGPGDDHRAAGEEGELHPARSDQESARFAAAGEAPCPPAGPSLRAPGRAAAVSRIQVCDTEPRTRRSAATALRSSGTRCGCGGPTVAAGV